MKQPATSAPFNRRYRLWFCVLCLAVNGCTINTPSNVQDAPLTLSELRAQRDELAQKPRGILFANDGVDSRDSGKGGMEISADALQSYRASKTPEAAHDPTEKLKDEFLMRRAVSLIDSQVSVMCYNTVLGGYPLTTHLKTDIGIPILQTGGPLGEGMSEAGLCPFELTVDFAHEHDMEAFYTFRANSLHDSFGGEGARYWRELNTFKREHPEYLFEPNSKRPTNGRVALDYEVPEVRASILAFLLEVCRNYDIDGLNIDFMRFQVLFRNTYENRPCTPEQREILTAFMQEVREMTEREGLRRGRPILIHVRVADSVRYNIDHGIDIKRWMNEDLVDMVTLGGYMQQLEPYAKSLAELKPFGKPLYVSIENPKGLDARGDDYKPVQIRMNAKSMRGQAMEALHAGADGVYVLNMWGMPENGEFMQQIGSIETLNGTDKDYYASWRREEAPGLPQAPYRSIETLSPVQPDKLAPGQETEVRFPMCDDLAAASELGLRATFTLRLRLSGVSGLDLLGLAINGHSLDLATAQLSHDWLTVKVPEAILNQGSNELSLTPFSGISSGASLKDLMLQVRYSPNGL